MNALSLADRAIARLDGAALTLPNIDLFVYSFMRQEAALSSQIEGTQASLEDLFEYEGAPERVSRAGDVTDIVNYIEAMKWGLKVLPSLPISQRLVRGLHERLLASGRGSQRTPGTFRTGQNYIGAHGDTIDTATFVPPAMPLMHPALDAWETFLHDRTLPALVRSALTHAQFETIHPFWDGNGRVGRMLITLKLCEEGILRSPLLYLSLYFKKNRAEYYANLQSVRDDGDWEKWLAFFLRGIEVTCRSALNTAQDILALRQSLSERLVTQTRSNKAQQLAEALFQRPYVTVNTVRAILGTTYPTANTLVDRFVAEDVLEQVTPEKRDRVFAFRPLLAILDRASRDIDPTGASTP